MCCHGRKPGSKALPLICLMALLVAACQQVQTERRLMPTPLGLALGVPHPAGDLHAADANADADIPVFVISGRGIADPDDSLNPFGSQRSRTLNLATAYVRIGEGMDHEELHEETVTDRRFKKATVRLDRVELAGNVGHVVPGQIQWTVKDDIARYHNHPWVQSIRQQMERSNSRDVTIFVHGYNTEFAANTLLAAELFHYLGHRGVMLSFEWPSESRLLGYIVDKGNASYSTWHFRSLISNIAKECDVDSITIVAHSAGTEIVVNALRELRLLEFDLEPEAVCAKYGISRVVLAAPDIDLMTFFNAVQDRFYEVAGRVAIYASPSDRALQVSEKLNGNPRLGRAVDNLQPWERELLHQLPEIELIDASVAESMANDLFGHSYFHRDPWISTDVGAFIFGETPAERGLVREAGEVFWRFPPDYPRWLKSRAEYYSGDRR